MHSVYTDENKEHPSEQKKVLKLTSAQINSKNISITGNCLTHPVKILI